MDFKTQLINIFSNPLPGERAHMDVLPISRRNYTPSTIELNSFRTSGVAIILFPNENKLNSILIERSVYDGTHSGQMGFPGGKFEERDETILKTAIRECHEEINVMLSEDLLITQLTEVKIPVSKFIIHPFLFYLEEQPTWKPDPREVQRVVDFELDDLLREDAIKFRNIKTGNNLILKDVPFFELNQTTVWGATALILSELRHVLREHL